MSRSRRRGGGPRLAQAVVVAFVVVLVLLADGFGAAAFTAATVDRQSSVDVAADADGLYGLDTATAVHTNATERLVTVTNRLDRAVTVTVTLDAASTAHGDLVVDGVTHGDQASFTLAAGDSRRVDIAVPDDGSLVGETVSFRAEASAAGLSVSAENRSVTIES